METTQGTIHTPSLQPIHEYPEPMFKTEAVAVLGMFPTVQACLTWVSEHRDLFPPRYIRGRAGRRYRMFSASEVKRIQEMRFDYGQ